MEKIALDVLHELQIKASSDVSDFTAELSLVAESINLNIPLTHISDSTYTFKIPKIIKNIIGEVVDYKIFVYMDNARFQVDEGKLKLVTEKDFIPSKIKIVKSKEVIPTETPVQESVPNNIEEDIVLVEEMASTIMEEIVPDIKPVDSTPVKSSPFAIIQTINKDIGNKQKLNNEIKDIISAIKNNKT